jgi:YbgC/YbaW family acyl-CoA thioester hydrolase
MSKVFTRRFRVRWSEVDATNRVPAAKYLEYLSEMAYDWGAANNLGFDESGVLGVVWVILETDIRFHHPLRFNDQFEFTIWMVEWRKVRGTRAFELKLKDRDVIIAQGMQQVASLDGDTLRPKAVSGELIDRFKIDEPRSFPTQRFPKIGENLAEKFSFQRRVEWGNLDSLVHLNNAEAIRYADEAVVRFLKSLGWSPDRLFTSGYTPVPRRIHVKYQELGIWADQLIIQTHLTDIQQKEATNVIQVVRETDTANIMQAIYQWGLEDTKTDRVRDLPDELHNALSKKLEEAIG